MIRIVLAALVLSGCAAQPEVAPEPATDDALLGFFDTPELFVVDDYLDYDSIEFVNRANQAAPEPAQASVAEPVVEDNLWQRIEAGFGLQPLPSHIQIEKVWRSAATSAATMEAFLNRGHLWLYYIVEEVERRGMPMELALLPYVESGFQLTARSYRGAAGPWQLMPRTGEYLGLQRTRSCDERLDVVASTTAALDYLEELGATFDGDWLLAIAAYNAGPGRVGGAVRRAKEAGKPADYWNIRLPRETRQYVPRLLALRDIVKNAQRFDIELPNIPNRPRFETVELERTVALNQVSAWAGISVDQLRRYNPCLRTVLTRSGGGPLVVPLGASQQVIARASQDDTGDLLTWSEYTVQRGDSLSQIAVMFNTTVGDLKALNNLRSDRIRIGQRLQIAGLDLPGEERTYEVQRGDSLWAIAQRIGTSVSRLRALNPGSTRLRIGQTLVIPAL